MLLTSKTIEGFANTPDTIAWGVTRQFAVPLQLSLARAAQSKQIHIASKCFQYIMKCGLDQEGIFRLSSQQSKLDPIRARIDDGEDINFETALPSPHDVASLLKMYFRLLPDPLVPFDKYDALLELMEQMNDPNYDEDERVGLFKDLLEAFPMENRYTLMQLCVLASEIADRCESNRMTVDALAVVMAPSVIRPPEDKSDTLEARAKVLVQMTACVLWLRRSDMHVTHVAFLCPLWFLLIRVQLAFRLMVTKWMMLFNPEELLS